MNCPVFLKLLNSVCSLVGSRHPCGHPEWATGSPVPVNLLCAEQPLVGTSLRSHRSMSPRAGASGSSSVPTLMVSSVFPHCKYEKKYINTLGSSECLTQEGHWRLLKVHQIIFPSNEVTGGTVYGLQSSWGPRGSSENWTLCLEVLQEVLPMWWGTILGLLRSIFK